MSAQSVTVVIPLYNHERFIGEALESVLAQTHPVDRIVVIDDGSIDRSVEVARQVADPRIEIHCQENAGAHHALNRGIRLALEADFIAILNSDDRYRPDRIASCLAHLGRHPLANLVCTKVGLIGDDGAPLDPSSPRSKWFDAVWSLEGSGLSLPERLGIANFPATTSNFFARGGWLRANPLRDYRYVHDYFHLVLSAVAGQLEILPEPLLDYRVHDANTISADPEKIVREMLRMNLDLAAHLAQAVCNDRAMRKAFADYARCCWSSVSGFRADVHQVLLALFAEGVDEARRRELIDWLGPDQFPELARFPNRALVNEHAGLSPLGPTSGVAEKFASLKDEMRTLKTERRELREYVRWVESLSKSRWMALGSLLGPGRGWSKGLSGDAARRLEALQAWAGKSLWLRMGARLGSRVGRLLG